MVGAIPHTQWLGGQVALDEFRADICQDTLSAAITTRNVS
jgi:hypothetical protein